MKNINKVPDIEFVRSNFFTKELLIIDGPPGSGKSMLEPILTSFARVEIECMEPFFDALPVLYKFKKISKDAAITILRLQVDNKLYESMISRNANFRMRDQTGVFNTAKPFKYFKRLFFKDGDIVLDRIRKENPIFHMSIHDMLEEIDLFLEAFGDGLRVIEMVRHPVDLVYSMNTHHHPDVGKNPRLWVLTLKSRGNVVPHHASGWAEEFLNESPVNRLIKIVHRQTKLTRDKFDSLAQFQKRQVLIIPFEEFAISPYKYLDLISSFIGSEITRHTKKALKKERVPRKIDIKDKKRRLQFIKENASKECLQILDSLVDEYENKYFKI